MKADLLFQNTGPEKKPAFPRFLTLIVMWLLVCPLLCEHMFAQSDDCEKIRVAVYFVEVTDEVFDHLNEKYGSKPKQAWIDEIDTKMLETLRANSPEIDFFSRRKNKQKDPHYTFQYCLHLIAIKTDIIIPSYANTYEDPISGYEITEYTDPVYDWGTAFWIAASLVVNSPCVPNLQYIVACELEKDLELELAMAKLSKGMWRIINLIEESERRRPVPARGPELEIDYEKEYLSLLTEEDRQMEVIAKVKNCKGEYLYRKPRSQPVYFPKDVNRCKYEQAKGYISWGSYKGKDIIRTKASYEAKGNYIVQKGIQASKEKVPLGSCGIGSTSEIQKDGELIIRGLEVKIKPERKEVFVGEDTKITITLNETDPDGNTYPVPDRKIDFQVSGLVNGKITPKGPYTTNSNGQVFLTYQAGDEDTRIDLTASFQPPKYPDKAEDHSSIDVHFPEVYARITWKYTYHNKYHDESEYGRVKEGESQETRRITINVEFEKEPVTIEPFRYNYKVKRYAVLSSSYEQTGNSFYSWSHGEEYTKSSFTESGFAKDLKETISGDTMRLHLDPKTSRIYQVDLPGFEASMVITGNAKSVRKERYGGIIDTSGGDYERKMSIDTIMRGDAENCDKVTGGDGKTSLKGECRYRNDQGRFVEEEFYSWEVKFRKKNESR